MECLRCRGMMVEERFEDLRGDPHDISFHGWRCVSCGDVADPVILYHRSNLAVAASHSQPPRTRPAETVKPWNLDIEAA